MNDRELSKERHTEWNHGIDTVEGKDDGEIVEKCKERVLESERMVDDGRMTMSMVTWQGSKVVNMGA